MGIKCSVSEKVETDIQQFFWNLNFEPATMVDEMTLHGCHFCLRNTFGTLWKKDLLFDCNNGNFMTSYIPKSCLLRNAAHQYFLCLYPVLVHFGPGNFL